MRFLPEQLLKENAYLGEEPVASSCAACPQHHRARSARSTLPYGRDISGGTRLRSAMRDCAEAGGPLATP